MILLPANWDDLRIIPVCRGYCLKRTLNRRVNLLRTRRKYQMKYRKNYKPHGFIEREEAARKHDAAGTWLKQHAEAKKLLKNQKRSGKKLPGKNTKIIPGNGKLCPRCSRPMQIREHDRIKQKHLNQPYYYNRWYYCTYPDCKTTQVNDDKFRVVKPVVWGDSWDDAKLNPDERPPWEDDHECS